ncbi:hypothetical protein ENBRE01_0775 [Enteropsectra breve]|nr:hypothetical protein ENBRE01_0775 [Enteropsectra breve]
MKTRSYKALRFCSNTLCTVGILSSIAMLIYMLGNKTVMNIEHVAMPRTVITLYSAYIKIAFFSIGSFLFSIYAFNIASGLLIKISRLLNFLLISVCTVIFFKLNYNYACSIKQILSNTLYSNSSLKNIFIERYSPKSFIGDLSTEYINEFQNLLHWYKILLGYIIAALLANIVMGMVARKITIHTEDIIAEPVISEMSRAGLNTSSLRVKRIVLDDI